MRETVLRRMVSSISLLQVGIIILVVVTALIHLQLGLSMVSMVRHPGMPNGTHPARETHPAGSSILAFLPVPLPILFILNCIGYIVLVIALYLPPLRKFQRIIRWLLITFTAITILAWFLIAGSHPNTRGIVDKVMEVALIVLLLVEEWQVLRLKRG